MSKPIKKILPVMLLVMVAGLCLAQSNNRSEFASKIREKNKGDPYAEKVYDDRVREQNMQAEKVIQIDALDSMTFSVGDLLLNKDQLVKFVLTNKGQKPHTLMIGSLDELKQQAQAVQRAGEAAVPADRYIRVMPGQTQSLLWRFEEAGDFYYGCLEPGHLAAGMINRIHVNDP